MNVLKKVLSATLFLAIFTVCPICVSSADYPDIEVPVEIIEITEQIGDMYGVCPELLQAIAFYESSYRQNATNGSHCGLMQVSTKWHSGRMEKLGVSDIYDPYGNVLVATDYLMELAEETESITYCLDIYHGDSKAEYNEENGIISNYAKKILALSERLEREHGK